MEDLGYNSTYLFHETLKRLGYLFYIMNPLDHNYEKISDVRDYYKEVTPLFFVTVFLEQGVRFLQSKPLMRVNDTICNSCHGILMELSKIPFKGAEVWVYTWIYMNYRLVTLPWDSAWTWILCWIVTDFCYYWMHRMIHQVNILWAIHETHHTPEDMMFTSPMRNHIFLLPIHWITYLPMAFGIPPTTYLVHYQISIIYQYWLHSEIVGKLHPVIEYVFSTPSHHRGHHGRNRRYIDKNFGGFLIVWDRIFGTIEIEDEKERPMYGVTTQMKSFNPLVIQTTHFVRIYKRFCEIEGVGNKLSVLFKGPGWSPGKPWTGDLNDIAHPAPEVQKYDPILPLWADVYIRIHYSIFLNSYFLFALNLPMISRSAVFAAGWFLTFTTITFGFILDKSRFAAPFEFLRCILYFLTDRIVFREFSKYTYFVYSMYANRMIFAVSLIFWMTLAVADTVRRTRKEKAL